MAKLVKLFACFRPRTDDGSESTPEFQPVAQSTAPTERDVVAYVELLRRTNEPLGLVLRGGADCDMAVHVDALRPGGVAEMSGALQVGDRILSINGTPTEHLIHSEVKALLENSGNVINLEISFKASPGANLDDLTVKKKNATIVLPRERNSFGFTISGGRTESRPITVSNVTMHSAAYKNGVLKVGDRITKVNGNDVSQASQMDTLSLLKASEDNCTLEIEYDVTLHEGLSEARGALLVELLKPKGASLGISLSGWPAHGEPIWISRIKEAGIADRCGALHVGDRLLSVNGVILENRTAQEVIQMLLHSDLHVKLEIIPSHNFPDVPDEPPEEAFSDSMSHISRLHSGTSRLSRRHSQLSLSSVATSAHIVCHPENMAVSLKADDIGFGLSLQGGASEHTNYPLVISCIEPGGPAARLGLLQVGDRILSINGVRMEGVMLQQALKFVQEAGDIIEMEVEFDVTDAIVPTSGTFEVKMVKTASLNLGITINGSHQCGDTIWISNLKKGGIAYRMGMLQPGDVLLAINDQSLETANLRDAAQLLKNAGEIVVLQISKDNTNMIAQSETIIFSVELHRNGQNLGITLTGSGHHPGHPIIISNIKEGGVAYKTGTLRTRDRILAINGESLYGKTVPEVVTMLRMAGDVVNLKISKAYRKSKSSRSKPGSPAGKPYRHGGRGDFGPPYWGRGRLSRTGCYDSSIRMTGMGGRRISATTLTTASGRSTPESHSTASLDHVSSLSSSHPRSRYEGVLERGRVTPIERPSAFRRLSGASGVGRPGSRSERRYDLDSYTYSGGFSGPDLLKTKGENQNRRSFTETDEEMSYEREHTPSQLRARRGSAPLGSPLDLPEGRWNFKSRRSSNPSYTYRVPIGRVSPLTSSEASRASASSPFPKQLTHLLGPNSATSSPVLKPVLTEKDVENAAKADSSDGVTTDKDSQSVSTSTILQSQAPTDSSSACLKGVEITLQKANQFMKELKTLAESGSSDQDSDSEPHAKAGKLSPYWQEKVVEQVKSAMTPTRMEPHTVKLKPNGADLGFSVADGLIEHGVYIKSVKPAGPADQIGQLQPFDRILKIGDRIVNPDDDCCKIVPWLKEVVQGDMEIALVVARNPLATKVALSNM